MREKQRHFSIDRIGLTKNSDPQKKLSASALLPDACVGPQVKRYICTDYCEAGGKEFPPFSFSGKKEVLIIRIKRGKARTKEVVPKERINSQITADKVRLIGSDGKQVGVVSLREALHRAEESNLDLVEISPNIDPPVCRILDFSKYYFQKEKKVKEARKKQHEVEVKEIKYGPNTEEHDYNFKKNNAIKFLRQHNKVKFTVRFRGRQMAHKELGYNVLEKLKADLGYIADVDSEPVSDRNLLSMVMSPKKDIEKILDKATQDKAVPAAVPATETQPSPVTEPVPSGENTEE